MSGLRIFLAPLSLLYWLVVVVRNLLFEIGVLRTVKVTVPVVSVGNISVGGTGKTPLIEYLARFFGSRGKKVAVISRGYKRTTRGYVVVSNGFQRCAEVAESGDEPSQLAEKLDGVIVAVDEDRVRAAHNVVREFKPDLILLDDGFQHRYLHRDIDIVVLTSEEILSRPWLLPSGNGREPLPSLERADMIVLSHCDDVTTFFEASRRLPDFIETPMVGITLAPVSVKNAFTSAKCSLEDIVGIRVVVFSGIGEPDNFEKTLASLRVKVVQHVRFPDHHRYSERDVETILRTSKEQQAVMILTTEKDSARLRGDAILREKFLKHHPVNYLEVQVEFVAGKETFEMLLAKC